MDHQIQMRGFVLFTAHTLSGIAISGRISVVNVLGMCLHVSSSQMVVVVNVHDGTFENQFFATLLRNDCLCSGGEDLCVSWSCGFRAPDNQSNLASRDKYKHTERRSDVHTYPRTHSALKKD